MPDERTSQEWRDEILDAVEQLREVLRNLSHESGDHDGRIETIEKTIDGLRQLLTENPQHAIVPRLFVLEKEATRTREHLDRDFDRQRTSDAHVAELTRSVDAKLAELGRNIDTHARMRMSAQSEAKRETSDLVKVEVAREESKKAFSEALTKWAGPAAIVVVLLTKLLEVLTK